MSDWLAELSKLNKFLDKNPQIEISPNSVVISGEDKTNFYRLFDSTRVAFLKERQQGMLDEALELSDNFAKAADAIIQQLGLSETKLFSKLNWFLTDPVDGLIRPLFDPLFDLLKAKIDMDEFELEGSKKIRSLFKELFKSGYEKWVLLSLASLLAPDRAFTVETKNLDYNCPRIEVDQRKGVNSAAIPELEDAKTLVLERGLEPAFIFPNIIIHSSLLNRFISLADDLTDAVWVAKQINEDRDWLEIREAGRPYKPIFEWPDMVVYRDNRPEGINLVSDFLRFCRPDLIIECMDTKEWYRTKQVDRVKKNYEFFRPRLGSFVISRFPIDEEYDSIFSEQSEIEKTSIGDEKQETAEKKLANIQILPIGYDAERLNQIVEFLGKIN